MPIRQAEKIGIDSGEIVKLDPTGEITRATFDNTKQYQTIWNYPGYSNGCACAPRAYLDELRDTAAWLGYPPELIDHYQTHGYAVEEIEELLYAGEI